jgi:hypothetical protein
MYYYITLCRLHEKYSILNKIKNLQVCYSGVITFVVVHYILDLPNFFQQINGGDQSTINWTTQI